uniref:Tyr recombinase domain-containing protein n=1 Tax=Phytophthora ramorum TaxID=164328 RepID=H3GYX2_PHYRM
MLAYLCLCLLWHLFGRASDLALLRKPNVSIDAGNVLFVRFIRMKTSEEQSLSLFPGTDFTTCPMIAIALALMMQTAPSPDVIDNLLELPGQAPISLSPYVPLLETLNHPTDTTGLDAPSTGGAETTPTIYSHVNRVLNRIAAGVKVALTSHSFRRGGAQHANGGGELTARWIFDRGAWNMSTTNKGFNYIFNTSKEDHKGDGR